MNFIKEEEQEPLLMDLSEWRKGTRPFSRISMNKYAIPEKGSYNRYLYDILRDNKESRVIKPYTPEQYPTVQKDRILKLTIPYQQQLTPELRRKLIAFRRNRTYEKITELVLDRNHSDDLNTFVILLQILHCKNMTSIKIKYGFKMHEDNARCIAVGIARLKSLKRLSFERIDITNFKKLEEFFYPIVEAVTKNIFIEELYLDNLFVGISDEYIHNFITKLFHDRRRIVTHLSLNNLFNLKTDDRQIESKSIDFMFGLLNKYKGHLQYLNIGNNYIIDRKNLTTFLAPLVNLQELKISNIKFSRSVFSRDDVTQLFSTICNSNIRHLNMRSVYIQEREDVVFDLFFKSKLDSLNISNCFVGSRLIFLNLMQMIKDTQDDTISNIKHLNLSNIALGNTAVDILATIIENGFLVPTKLILRQSINDSYHPDDMLISDYNFSVLLETLGKNNIESLDLSGWWQFDTGHFLYLASFIANYQSLSELYLNDIQDTIEDENDISYILLAIGLKLNRGLKTLEMKHTLSTISDIKCFGTAFQSINSNNLRSILSIATINFLQGIIFMLSSVSGFGVSDLSKMSELMIKKDLKNRLVYTLMSYVKTDKTLSDVIDSFINLELDETTVQNYVNNDDDLLPERIENNIKTSGFTYEDVIDMIWIIYRAHKNIDAHILNDMIVDSIISMLQLFAQPKSDLRLLDLSDTNSTGISFSSITDFIEIFETYNNKIVIKLKRSFYPNELDQLDEYFKTFPNKKNIGFVYSEFLEIDDENDQIETDEEDQIETDTLEPVSEFDIFLQNRFNMEFGLPSDISTIDRNSVNNKIDENPQSYYSDSDSIPSSIIDEFERMALYPEYITSDIEEVILYDPDNIEHQRDLDEL